jgi:hypothetical protein
MKTTKSGELFGADVATRALRKKAVADMIGKPNRIMKAEECYMENIPGNMQGSDIYFAAEECTETLYSAIGFLQDAYDN